MFSIDDEVCSMPSIVTICCRCSLVKVSETVWLKSPIPVDRKLVSYGFCPECFKLEMDIIEKHRIECLGKRLLQKN